MIPNNPLAFLGVVLLICTLVSSFPVVDVKTVKSTTHVFASRDLLGSVLSTTLLTWLKWRGGSLSQQQQIGGGFWGQGNLNGSAYRTDGGTHLSNGYP